MVVVVVVVVMQSWVDFEVVVYTLPDGFGHVPHMYAKNYPADFDGNLHGLHHRLVAQMVDDEYAMHAEPHDALLNSDAIQDTDVLEQEDNAI